MPKQIFYDPQRKRWKRLRRVFDLLALFGAITGIIFIIGLLRMRPMHGLDLQSTTKRYRALSNPPAPELTPREKLHQSAHRKTDLKPSDVVLNTTEGLRAAFYTDVDPAAYASLKQHIKEIDLLFPEWLHVITPDGRLTAFSADNAPFPVIDSAGVHGVDRENKVAHIITTAKEDTEIFPMVNNYNPKDGAFEDNVGQFLGSPEARANFLHQVDQFLAANTFYRGLTLDFQALGPNDQNNYNQLIAALYADFHPRNLRLYVNVAVSAPPAVLSFIAANSDGVVLMNYDQHQTGTQPGPIAGQDWFENNLRTALGCHSAREDHLLHRQLRLRLDHSSSRHANSRSQRRQKDSRAHQAPRQSSASIARAGRRQCVLHVHPGGLAGRLRLRREDRAR